MGHPSNRSGYRRAAETKAGLRCAILFFFFFPFPLFAQEDLKARIKQLEVQVHHLTEEVLQLRESLRVQEKITERYAQEKPVAQATLYDGLIESFKKEKPENELYSFYRRLIHSHVWLGGYLDVKFEGKEGQSGKGVFDLSSLGLSLRSSFHENLAFEGEIELSEEDPAISISHAYLLVAPNPLLNLKAGVIRVPFGQYNLLYTPPYHSLGSIPLSNRHLLPVVWSEPGVSLFGKIERNFPVKLTYEAMLSNGVGEKGFDSKTGNRQGKQSLHEDNNRDKQLSGRIGVVSDFGLDVAAFYAGISGMIGRYDDRQRNEYRGLAIDYLLRVGPFTLIGDHDRLQISGEYVRFEIERDLAILQQHPDISPSMEGNYVQIEYLFFPEPWRDWKFFNRESTLGISFRYEWVDLNRKIKGASVLDDPSSHTLGFFIRPIGQSIVRIEYGWIREFVENRWAWNNRILASFATHF